MRSEHWSIFWQQGYVTTFGESLQHNYTGSVKAFWETLFTRQKKYPCKMLDLATGNGAIAYLAAEKLTEEAVNYKIHAIDHATISQNIKTIENKLSKTIVFHSNTPCESLPFNGSEFDLATSQFGIEYSNSGQSLPELFRVLKMGAEAHFICHHADSDLIKSARQELDIYRAVMGADNLFKLTNSLIHSVDMKTFKPCKKKSAYLNDFVNGIQKKFSGNALVHSIISDIAHAIKLIRPSGVQAAAAFVQKRSQEYTAGRERLNDMTKAALNQQSAASLTKQALNAGFSKAHHSPFQVKTGMIGFHIHLVK